MPVRFKIFAVMALLVVGAVLAFSVLLYHREKRALLDGIDAKLLTAAEGVRHLLGPDYHDRIIDKNFVSDAEHQKTVDTLNHMCVDLGLQYLWSVMRVDGKVVFTSATSPEKDVSRKDYAAFFEEHTNPESFQEVFLSMQPTYSSFHNKWGHGRMLLLPGVDSRGRKYAFGASMSVASVDALLRRTAMDALLVGALLLLAGLMLSVPLANSLAGPLGRLTSVAKSIADGNFTEEVHEKGSREIESLSASITHMNRAIHEKITELRDSRENLTITLNSIGDGVIVMDPLGAIARMNPVAEHLTGWSSHEAQGHPLPEVACIINAESGAPVRSPALQALHEGKVTGAANPLTLVARGGRRHQIAESAAPLRNEKGETIGVVLVFRDITAQYALESERSRMVAILESTSDLVSTSKPDGSVMYINRAGRELLGWPGEGSLKDKNISEAHPRSAFERVMFEGLPAAAEKGIWRGETAFLGADGREIPVSQVIMAHRGAAGGSVEYYSTIARDISERKLAEQERSSLEAELHHAQKLQVVGTMAGGIAHDFNNILAPIIGNIELLVSELPPDSPARPALLQVLTAAARGAELVQQILTFSGRGAPARKALFVAGAVDEVFALMRAVVPATIEMRKELAAGCPQVMADSGQLRQILMNLVINAHQAIAAGHGRIEITAKPLRIEGAAGEPPGLSRGAYVVITVSDTGSGMDAFTQQRIFEPFFTTKEAGKGSGLGLSVVHGIVKSYGGAVTVDSSPGQGSTFHVYLPAVEGGEEAETASEMKIAGGHACVLLVDDEAMIIQVAQRMLENYGYQVVTACDGAQAVRLFNEHPGKYDLVITDLTMPGMTGVELAAELHCLRPGLPVILISGYREELARDELQRIGISAFLRKPFRLHQLHSVVTQVLKG